MRKRVFWLPVLLAALLTLTLAAHSAETPAEREIPWAALPLGLSGEDTASLLGAPDRSWAQSAHYFDRCFYGRSDLLTFHFEGDALHRILYQMALPDDDPAAVAAALSPLLAQIAAVYGESPAAEELQAALSQPAYAWNSSDGLLRLTLYPWRTPGGEPAHDLTLRIRQPQS